MNRFPKIRELQKEAANLHMEIRSLAAAILKTKSQEVYLALCRTKHEKLVKLETVKTKIQNLEAGNPILGMAFGEVPFRNNNITRI